MRNTLRTLMLAALLGALAPQALAETAYRLGVNGISCPFCAYGIEKELGKLDGVARVTTQIEDGVVRVEMAGDAVLDHATAERAVKKAGFSLKSFEPIDGETGGNQ